VTIQEAAYSSLLKEERRELHARVASWLLQETAIGESSQPAVLGYHYARAGNIPEAIEAWLQAGKSALRRSATKEAVAHLREGISLISKLPASQRRYEAEIALQSNLAMAYTANAGGPIRMSMNPTVEPSNFAQITGLFARRPRSCGVLP
jgi:Predicted ATPase